MANEHHAHPRWIKLHVPGQKGEFSPTEDMKTNSTPHSYHCSVLVQVSDAKFPKRVSKPTFILSHTHLLLFLLPPNTKMTGILFVMTEKNNAVTCY